jgi:AbrB family looped-hinge helix DNA binding protein
LDNQAKITSKGQITLPLAIRKSLGVRAGNVLLFEEDKNGVRVRAAKSKESICQVPRDRQPGYPLGEESPHSLDASDARPINDLAGYQGDFQEEG